MHCIPVAKSLKIKTSVKLHFAAKKHLPQSKMTKESGRGDGQDVDASTGI
jgi:hypothetical protein